MPASEAEKKHGNKVALKLKSIGTVQPNGRYSWTFGYMPLIEGKPDLPLSSLLIPLIQNISALARYSTVEAAKTDIETLLTFIQTLNAHDTPVAPKGEPGAPGS